MLNILFFLNCISFLLLLGVFVFLLKQWKEIKVLKTLLDNKQATEDTVIGNSIPVKLDLNTLNNLIATGITNNSQSSPKKQDSSQT
ncbi:MULTISPECIES: hypothetical protein [Bacillus cereus group]|uniref:hypothetical protein n=1 Tax=Bacillus cereus group TaxID=86661 RepID=UPI0011A5A7DF|nr:hypothetical protein [Bacillus thuringiensis]